MPGIRLLFAGRPERAAGLGLVLLVLLSYWGVWSFDFTNLDDQPYVVENPRVHGVSGHNARWALSSFHESYWAPLTWLSFMVDHELWGLDPAGYHLTNVVLHAVAVLLLWRVLSRMTGEPWRSLLVAALFAVHPVHVEAVAWIAERKEMLSSVFWMLALGAYFRYSRAPSSARYLPVAVAMALGLLSKPTLVTLPLVLLLVDYWPLGRLRSPRELVARAIEKVPLAALSIASSLITSMAARDTILPLSVLGLEARLANAALAYLGYLRLFLWPVGLSAFYPHAGPEATPIGPPLAATLVLAAATVILVRLGKHHPPVAVGWLWFLITLVPVLGLVQVGDQAMADRFLHIPSIGLSILLVWGLGELFDRAGVRGGLAGAAAVALLVTLGAATRMQSRYWRDSIALHTRAIDVTGGAYLPHFNLAQALADAGRLDQAAHHYRASLRFNPLSADAHANLGLCYVRLGRSAEALEALRAALDIDPSNAAAHNNLGLLLASRGDLEAAVPHFVQAIRLDPTLEYAHYNLALAYQQSGRPREAEGVLDEAVRLGKRSEAPDALRLELRRAIEEADQ